MNYDIALRIVKTKVERSVISLWNYKVFLILRPAFKDCVKIIPNLFDSLEK